MTDEPRREDERGWMVEMVKQVEERSKDWPEDLKYQLNLALEREPAKTHEPRRDERKFDDYDPLAMVITAASDFEVKPDAHQQAMQDDFIVRPTDMPWTAEEDSLERSLHLIWSHQPEQNSVLVARTCFAPNSKANAEFIVEAANSYHAHQQAMRGLQEHVKDLEHANNSWSHDYANLAKRANQLEYLVGSIAELLKKDMTHE